jgi:hypothetical protein
MLLKEELRWPRDCITSVINPYRWLMVWQWRQFLQPPLQDKCGHRLPMPNHIKPKIFMFGLCQIVLNWKLSCTFKKRCAFSLRLRQNHAKGNHMQPDLTVLEDSTKTHFREIGFEVVNWMNWLGVRSTGGLLWWWTKQWCDGWKEGHKSRTVCPLSYIYFNLYIVVIHFYVFETNKSAQKTCNNRNNNTHSHSS